MKLIGLSVFLFLTAGAASGATMTFSDVPPGGAGCGLPGPSANSYTEAGITAVGGPLASYVVASFGAVGQSAHMDDGGTQCAREIAFSMDKRFDAISIDVISRGFEFWGLDPALRPAPLPYDNIRTSGFRHGLLVAESFFQMSVVAGEAITIFLSDDFRKLDEFVVEVVNPYAPGKCAPCGHFNLDNVVLAPVPLPASAVGMLSGLGLMLLGRLGGRAARRHHPITPQAAY